VDPKKKKKKCHGRVSVEKFKIMLAYVQIMALFRTNYAIRWPGSVRALFRLMDFFDFNLVSLVALECMHRSTYYFTFLVSLGLPAGFALVLILLKKIGVCRYERRLMKIPRTCVVTGVRIKNFMEPKQYHSMRVASTINALKDAGWGTPTPRQIRAELAESTPLLRPASSISSGNEMGGLHGKKGLTTEQKSFISTSNTMIFKKRVFIRFDHLAYNNKIFNMFFVILMLIYPSICLRVTRFFKCDSVGNIRVLGADLYTNCYDTEYYVMAIPAILGLIFFVAGIPMFFLFLLWQARTAGTDWKWEACSKSIHRKRMALAEAQIDAQLSREFWVKPIGIQEEKKACINYFRRQNFRDHRVKNRLGFIYYRYNERVWWYEIVELSRKLILNSLVALVTPGEDSQIVTGAAICLFYFTMMLTIRPYKTKSDLNLAATTHASLFFTLLCGLMLNMRVPFLGKYLFPTKIEREYAEMLFVEIVVMLQVGLVCLQFLLGVIWDGTCSNETKFLMSLEENRDLVLKQAIATISAKFGTNDTGGSGSSNSRNKGSDGEKFWAKQKTNESDTEAVMDNYVNDVVSGQKEQASDKVIQMDTTKKKKIKKVKIPSSKAVRKLFKDYDFDESGMIDLEELRDMISEMHTLAEGEPMSNEDAQTDAELVMKTLDADNSGLLGEDEFVDWVSAGLRIPKALRDASSMKDERGRRLQNFLSSVETLANEMDDEMAEQGEDDLVIEEIEEIVPVVAKRTFKRTKTEVML